MNKAVLSLGIAVAILGAALYFRGGVSYREGAEAALARGGKALPVESVLAIRPAVPSGAPAPKKIEAAKQPSADMREYEDRQWGALAARLEAAGERTAEQSWLLAEVLERCAQRLPAGRASAADAGAQGPAADAIVRQFEARLAADAPHRARRVEAYRALAAEGCEGVRAPREGEVRQLLEQAASQGEPRARVKLVRLALVGEPGKPQAAPMPRVSAHLDTLRAAFESADPVAMAMAAELLTLPGADVDVRAAGKPVDAAAFRRAVQLVGCELGARCDAKHEAMAVACALHGWCEAKDLREHYLFYAGSPYQSQQMQDYVDALRRGVVSRDGSAFTMAPAAGSRQGP